VVFTKYCLNDKLAYVCCEMDRIFYGDLKGSTASDPDDNDDDDKI
jgi:hypothetical protein